MDSASHTKVHGNAPQSPDINPIANLWEHLERKIRSSQICNKQDLKYALEEEWRHIPASHQRLNSSTITSSKSSTSASTETAAPTLAVPMLATAATEWRSIFAYFLDVAVVNAWFLNRKMKPQNSSELLLNFCRLLAFTILKRHGSGQIKSCNNKNCKEIGVRKKKYNTKGLRIWTEDIEEAVKERKQAYLKLMDSPNDQDRKRFSQTVRCMPDPNVDSITEEEMDEALVHCKNKKTPGVDRINTELIKYAPNIVKTRILELLNVLDDRFCTRRMEYSTNDQMIISDNENELKKAIFRLNKVASDFNMKISAEKTKTSHL
ncbi:hypothetical protein ANN_10996 [Periplaneta americana]|uniref:Uncharacterized protein n=1 Tax=Periplaneta americana TaxID=6978 RepID=A0ABQ8T3S2_PERAM|nr:hypothetical protein ANN_10996 [Periplaneta americana]